MMWIFKETSKCAHKYIPIYIIILYREYIKKFPSQRIYIWSKNNGKNNYTIFPEKFFEESLKKLFDWKYFYLENLIEKYL